jgi:hypothetical protein
VGPTPRRLSRERTTPPDLEESRAHGILPGSLEDAAAALPVKSYDIRIAGVIPDATVGSLRPHTREQTRHKAHPKHILQPRWQVATPEPAGAEPNCDVRP